MKKCTLLSRVTDFYFISSLFFSLAMITSAICFGARSSAKKHRSGSRIAHTLQAMPASHNLLTAATHNHVAHFKSLMQKAGHQKEILYAMPLLKAAQKGYVDIASAIVHAFPIHTAHDSEYKKAYYEARTTAVKNNNLALSHLFLENSDPDHRSQHGYTLLSHAVSNPAPSEELVATILQKARDLTYGPPGDSHQYTFLRATNTRIKQIVYAATREQYAQKALPATLASAHSRAELAEQKATRQHNALVSFEEQARTHAYAHALITSQRRLMRAEQEEAANDIITAPVSSAEPALVFHPCPLPLRRATPVSMDYAHEQDTELPEFHETSDASDHDNETDIHDTPVPDPLSLVASNMLENNALAHRRASDASDSSKHDFVAVSESSESSDTLEEVDGWLLS